MKTRSALASRAFMNSSSANENDFPSAIDCAEVAGNPAASSSVREARNTCSMPPKRWTTRCPRVGPIAGVSTVRATAALQHRAELIARWQLSRSSEQTGRGRYSEEGESVKEPKGNRVIGPSGDRVK